ncbi:16S rRNA (guanine(527)-N(7))-methyltransferase RsmG [Sulfuriferula sp. AH1]|uniref:16S rRNA (guanine(527)-N(7))-methyltransferase RsmG n=1 Tax=Sulfuriferula sp. AH1 TaxID=1985873 RepID=UPI000B3B5CAA|nr:16S rRNA (guanine(527)-N(7))-methyltransferase RsmG [Sulfuriferula sp. AH1]ARU32762.1 16S rRNA (guanine(527)-N(7))-methyltransferase RsmG [Sulfuriferula sp. AH1]
MMHYLIDQAASMGVAISPAQSQQLFAYLNLIGKWNRVHNLTAVRDPHKMLTHHILDSLSVNSYVKAENLLDVGSGAGLPGIPLAIINPHQRITLSDSNRKKAAFQQQAIIELGLSNVNVMAGRVEELRSEQKFNGIISRAFSEIGLFIELTRHLLSKGGYWYAMKGIYPEQELNSLPDGIEVSSMHELNVRLLDAKRHLVILKEVDD